ncbi:class I SAM-dependent methyltransferase [Vagococcus coleopterorum]|uniref:Class I SAM-dependent methyltransferase n=1 Tax=Vagococcus coleopterorum TaxID=2714946 RepID=A0A6G8AMB4_9ENTE|nr:class I SAM-dependent methyltransferase [Vagococcus coleopterorum]QIL46092.1 class I SAM-dependent methyltransferase [Vagococcus coleopterorum]
MPQNKVEKGFELLDQCVTLMQGSLNSTFIDSYIEVAGNLVNNYQVQVQDGLPNAETATKLTELYTEFKNLDLAKEERRKVTQLVLLKGTMAEPLQPNHQLTPDSLGFLFVYLAEQLLGDDKRLTLLDLTAGMGNLMMTVMTNLELAGYKVWGTGVDVDDTLLTITALNSQILEQEIQLFHQDSLQNLLLEPSDFAIADLPIGYYPDDENAQNFVTGVAEGHSYAHHLLMEQSMAYVKGGGFGVFLVPSNFLETEQADKIKEWITDKVYLQGILQLPTALFKNKDSRKSIIIIQNHGEESRQAKEVLLADVPSLKDAQQMQQFFKEVSEWKNKNLN